MSLAPDTGGQADAATGSITELSCYVLPGRVVDPSRATDDARVAEDLGLGTVWVSERFDQKESGVLLGAIAQATSRIRIGAGVIHPNTRHPLLIAALGATLQGVSGGRAVLGFGRNAFSGWANLGVASPTLASLEDVAGMLRRLWAGEEVSYSGPAGDYPSLRMGHRYEGAPPPLMLAAMGPRTLELGGRAFDGVITQTLTPDALARSVQHVRKGAEEADRDPAGVEVIHVLVTAPDAPPEKEAAIVAGRLVTYLQAPGMGEFIAELNGWDLDVLDRLRSHPLLASLGKGLADQAYTLDELAGPGGVLPAEWIRGVAAVGTASECAARAREYLDAGATQVLLHGSMPADLSGLVAAYAAHTRRP
jgi:probable F420-dependent oxidoreductase